MDYIRKTARYNGKKYEATGKTEFEALQKLADKLAAAKRGEETIGGSMTVIMLTARDTVVDKVSGLDMGADDYITKPFNPLELMARVKAQLRRYTRYNEADKAGDCRDIIDFNGLVINRATHECTLYDRELGLTPIEFDILWMLCENRGQVISAERLFESVWGEKYLDRNNTVKIGRASCRERV